MGIRESEEISSSIYSQNPGMFKSPNQNKIKQVLMDKIVERKRENIGKDNWKVEANLDHF